MSSSYQYFENKVDGSGCVNTYCLDKANGRCVNTTKGICCRCECSKSLYPYADEVNKKCVQAPPATISTTKPMPTEKTTRKTTTKTTTTMSVMQTTTEEVKSTVVIAPPPPLTKVTTSKPMPTLRRGTTRKHVSFKQPEVTTAAASCKDLSPHCKPWAGPVYNYCDESSTYYGYMKGHCRESCGWCPTQRPTTVMTTVPTGPNCKDNSSSCKYWKGKGYCTNQFYQYQMKTDCPKTCGFCMAPPPTIRASTTTVTQKPRKPSVVTQKPAIVSRKPQVVSVQHSPRSPTTLSSTKMSSNTTAIPPRLLGKKSSPVGAIAGASAGIILLIICIVIAYICIKRRRNRSRSKETSKSSINGMKENGNKVNYPSAEAPFSKDQKIAEDLEMREAENPYYKSADGPKDVENHYYSPGEVLQGVHSPNQHDIYYSSADVVKPTDEKEANKNRGDKTGLSLPGLTQEYAYARADSPQTPSKPAISPPRKPAPGKPKPVHENHYAALGESSNEPGLYQTLQKPSGLESPDSDVLEAENPYYKPARVAEPALLKTDPEPVDPGKGLSLKNNAGSRENVSLEYLEVLPNENHYQGLTIPNQNPIYQALTQDDGYLDMSVGDAEDPGADYTYVDPAEHRI